MAAAATTWHDRVQMHAPKSWLLTDGSVIHEPPLEETTSGRKVRIKGSAVSMFARDVDDLIFQGVRNLAAQTGSKVWMPLDEGQRRNIETGYFEDRLRKGVKPHLHLLNANPNRRSHTTAWWRFRHPSLPVEAVIVVEMKPAYTGYGRSPNTAQTVTTTLFMPSTDPDMAAAVQYVTCQVSDLSSFSDSLPASARQVWREFVRDNEPNWYQAFTLGQRTLDADRESVRVLLQTILSVDGFDQIDVPDLRDHDHPAWLRLELQDSNISGEFLQSLRDYLDGDGIVEEVKRHWDEMVRLFAASGLVMATATEDNFASALAGGDPVEIRVLSTPAEVGHGYDHEHSLTLHLPSGTVVVNCQRRTASQDDVGQKWEEALTMAQLSGREDELLAYAREYARTEQERRAKQILKERRQ